MSNEVKSQTGASLSGMNALMGEAGDVMGERQEHGTTRAFPVQRGWVGDWPRWTPYAAVAWSLLYAVLALCWALTGRGFPYPPDIASDPLSPLLGRFGPIVAWVVIILAGLPAVAMGTAMLRGMKNHLLRPLLIAAGALLAAVLLLLMTGLGLLMYLGYIPAGIYHLLIGSPLGLTVLGQWVQWATIHQLLCLAGGFLWLAATLIYVRRSGGACEYCGRRDGVAGWQSPKQAARWGRIAVYVAMVPPILYALTRYAWALGIPLGMSEEYLRHGQASGTWISGLFLANFGLVGALLMLGLVQRWGEVFPRWMLGVAGRRVPIALAVVPAALVSVLLTVGGIVIGSALSPMASNLATTGAEGFDLVWGLIIQVGPTLLFPVWGVALAVATLGYYYRRRSPCGACGRGASGEAVSQTGGFSIKRHPQLG